MITTRTAKQCGQADFGGCRPATPSPLATTSTRNYWASHPCASSTGSAGARRFLPARTYPKVDILNLILEGEAEYRDSDGNHVQAKAGEALLIATQRREL